MLKTIILIALAVTMLGGAYLYNSYLAQRITDVPPQVFEPTAEPSEALTDAPALTTYVSGRQVIWAMDFLPDGRMLFTERDGTVSIVAADGRVEELLKVTVQARGESGLHGIAVDPDFARNRFIYLYYTYQSEGAGTLNRVSRYTLDGTSLTDEAIIVDEIPGATTHDGGRIKFGPDDHLYITTGDAQVPTLSQERASLAGKILRVTRSGEPAPGNPFGTLIYSYGHRNPQGLTWDDAGVLWATEHGPSARDELNRIEAGANYGWPQITGTEARADMRSSIIQSGQSTWAPAGAAHYNGSIFFGGLRGSALYEYNPTTEALTTHLKNKFGRIRDVVVGPDGFLYIATSNRDGRGLPTTEDDRILRINPLKLTEM